ncbi:MAG: hypothetical protein ACFCUJ_12550 [Thiotrichales bacterium]
MAGANVNDAQISKIQGRLILNRSGENIIVEQPVALRDGDVIMVLKSATAQVRQDGCTIDLDSNALYTVREFPNCSAAERSVVAIDPSFLPQNIAFNEETKTPTEKAVQSPAADVAAIFEERGALTPRGSWIVEPSLSFTHSSATQVAIDGFTVLPSLTIGLIDISEVARDTLTATLGLRYGLTSRLELEARVPFVTKSEDKRSRELGSDSPLDSLVSSDGSGIGDAELSMRYQLTSLKPGSPYYIGNLRVKSATGSDPFEVKRRTVFNEDGVAIGEVLLEQPTGSGFVSVSPSLTVIYPTEPAVLFGNLSYIHNIPRDVGENKVRVQPGDAFGFNFGMGFSINPKTSFNLGYDHTVIDKTKVENDQGLEPVFDRTHIGSMLFGMTHTLKPGRSVGISLGVGATEQAPDVSLTIKSPFSL